MHPLLVRAGLSTAAAALVLAAAAPASAIETWTHNFAQSWASHYVRATGDVNGDGFADLIGFGYHDTFISLSNGAGFLPSKVGVNAFGHGNWNQSVYPLRLADVNGDGRDDIIGFGYHDVFVASSNGNGFAGPRAAYRGFTEGSGWRLGVHERLVGDVTGDGRADIVAFGHNDVFVAPSNGTGFSGASSWSRQMTNAQGFYAHTYQRLLGDVNGDGRLDAIAVAYDGMRVMLSQGNRFGGMYTATADLGVHQRGSIVDSPRAVADVNGDGRADLLAFLPEGIYVALSNGHDFTGGAVRLDDFGAQAGWNRNHWRLTADVNGDGKADIVGVHDERVDVARASTNGRFDDPYQPLSGGDFVTRFTHVAKGLCLSSNGSGVYQRPCDRDHPYGWVLEANADGSYGVMQDGKCLYATDFDQTIETVQAEAAACGRADGRWMLERNKQGEIRLRNRRNNQCLRVPGSTTSDLAAVKTVACDGSSQQLWRTETLRPRTMQTPLRVSHSGLCMVERADGRVVQRVCDDSPAQRMTLTDDGHGGYAVRNDATGRCLTPHASNGRVTMTACAAGQGPRWALEAAADGRRFVISKQTGRCLDISGSGMASDTDVQSWSCHGGPNQQWQMPDMASAALMTFTLQNVGAADGTMLVVGNAFGGYVTRDPVAIMAYLRRSNHWLADEPEVLSFQQRAEFEARVGSWDAELPADVTVAADVLSVSADYRIGLDGVDTGVEATLASQRVEFAGVLYQEARVLTTEARVSIRYDGVELSPAVDIVAVSGGFGDPDGSYAGLSAGLGSRGFSTAARWGQNGQYGATVPLAVVAVDVYVNGDDVISAAVFAADVGEWVADAAVEVFSSAWGWSAGAFNTATAAIGNVLGDAASFVVDVGDSIIGGISSGFGLW